MKWTRDRFAHTVSAEGRTQLDTALLALSEDIQASDLGAARVEAAKLGAVVDGLRGRPA
jgi:hypothetical protein